MTKAIVTTKTEPCRCPACSALLDATTGPGAPEPGDVSLCATCGEVLRFDDAVKIAAVDLNALANDPSTSAQNLRKLLYMQREIRAGALRR